MGYGVKYIRKKPALIEWLTKLEDEQIPEKLLDLSMKYKDYYQLSKEERESIFNVLDDLKKGDVVPNSDVKKAYEKWL